MSNKRKNRKGKKFNRAAYSQRYLETKLHEVWYADGECLKETEAGGVISVAHAEWILGRKQEWTAMLFAFCENQFENYVKTAIKPYPGHHHRSEISDRVAEDLFAHCTQQNADHFISAGCVLVPSLDADLLPHKSAFIDRFERWGAFDRLVWFSDLES